MAINPDLARLRKEIDQRLRDRRPDRYLVRDTVTGPGDADEVDADDLELDESTEWLDEVAAELVDEYGEAFTLDAVERYIRALVGTREGVATKGTNARLRVAHKSGAWPLDWFEFHRDPLAIVERVILDGRIHVRESRVALEAVTPADYDAFAKEERRRAMRDAARRNATCDAAEWARDELILGGFDTQGEAWR